MYTLQYAQSVNELIRQTNDLVRQGNQLVRQAEIENQRRTSRLSCGQLLPRASEKERQGNRWVQYAANAPTEYNRNMSHAAARGNYQAAARYRAEYYRRCK